MHLGNNTEAVKHMKEAKKLTGEISETKHNVISSALDSLMVIWYNKIYSFTTKTFV